MEQSMYINVCIPVTIIHAKENRKCPLYENERKFIFDIWFKICQKTPFWIEIANSYSHVKVKTKTFAQVQCCEHLFVLKQGLFVFIYILKGPCLSEIP